MVHQHLREGLALRIDTQRADAAAAEAVMQHEIEPMDAGEVEALDPRHARLAEPAGDSLLGQRRPDGGQVLRAAGDDADIGEIALVAAAPHRQFDQRDGSGGG